jgi:hypothetical protein
MRKGFLAYFAVALWFAARAEAQYLPNPAQPAPAPPGSKQLPTANVSQPVQPNAAAGINDPAVSSLMWDMNPPGRPDAAAGGFAPVNGPCPTCSACAAQPTQIWASADYLLWWIRPGPLSTPLVTTGSPADPIPGALGQPNTQVLFGNSNLDYGTASGLRLAAGVWFPEYPALGIEGCFFVLERRSVHFDAASDPNGNPVIARPVISALDGSEFAYTDALPGIAAGGVGVSSTTRLESFDINFSASVTNQQNITVNLLAGFRTLYLQEDIRIQDSITPLQAGVFLFQTGPADPPSSLAIMDYFRTSNNFYGGQLGARLHWSLDRLDVAFTGKLALGVTQQLINVAGSTSLSTPGADTMTGPGGILAQPTNSGRFLRNEFSVVPEIGINLGCQITPNLKAVVGYNFLYWTNVARPGDQIDRTVNFTQVQIDPSFGPLTGAARPALTAHSTDFWAQGINFGIEIQY